MEFDGTDLLDANRRILVWEGEVGERNGYVIADAINLAPVLVAALEAAESARGQLHEVVDALATAYANAVDDRGQTTLFMQFAMPKFLNSLTGLALPSPPEAR